MSDGFQVVNSSEVQMLGQEGNQSGNSATSASVPTSSSSMLTMRNFSIITKDKLAELEDLVEQLMRKAKIAELNVFRTSQAITKDKGKVEISSDLVVKPENEDYQAAIMALQHAIFASLKAEAILAAANAVYLWQDSANAQNELQQLSYLIDATKITRYKIQQVLDIQLQIMNVDLQFVNEQSKDINFWELQECIWDARLKNLLVTKLAKELALGADQTPYIEALQVAYGATKKVVEQIQDANFGDAVFIAGANSQEWQQFLRICQQQVKRLEKHLLSVGIMSKAALAFAASRSLVEEEVVVSTPVASTTSVGLAEAAAAPAPLAVAISETSKVISQKMLDVEVEIESAITEALEAIAIAEEIFVNIGGRRITKEEATELSKIIEIIEVVCKKAGKAEKICEIERDIRTAETWATVKLRWREKVTELTNRLLATVVPVSSLASLAPAPVAASTTSDSEQAAAAAPVARMQYRR